MGIFRGIASQIILNLGDGENEFRQENLSVDKAQIILVIVLVALTMALMAVVDYQLFQNAMGLFRWMVWYRGIYVFITAMIVMFVVRARDPRELDMINFVWILITTLFLILFNFTRPSNYAANPFNILFPFAIYLLSPLNIRHNIALAVSFSIGTILVDVFYRTGLSPSELSAAVSSQVLVHLLGLPSGMQLQSYRRRSFKAYLDQKDAREMANYLINIDGLTKCMTRLYFMELAEKEFLRTKRYELPFSLLMLDLDHFKRINDTYGHQVGDQVLQRFAAVVLEQKRAQDIFGRLGGEEFGLLLPNTGLQNAKLVAERIQQTWAVAPLAIASKTIYSTVSIGVVEINVLDSSFDGLLQRADHAMYTAKRRGRNRVALG